MVASNHEIIIVHGAGQPVNQLTKLLHLSVDVAGGFFPTAAVTATWSLL